MRLLISIFLISILTVSCKTDILSLRHRPYYREYNIYNKTNGITFKDVIFYNRPHWIDEEFYYLLLLNISDTSITKNKKYYTSDTTKIKCQFILHSVWRHNVFNDIKGDIKIIKIHDNKIRIRNHLKVQYYDKTIKINGRRTFRFDNNNEFDFLTNSKTQYREYKK